MRRSIGLLCLAACLAVPAQTSAAPRSLSSPAEAALLPPAEPGVVADESAMASWMFPTDRPRHSRWIFAGAYRDATAGGRTLTTGFAVKGSCEVVRAQGETVTRCSGRGIGGPLPETAFEVDPTLDAARLVLRDDGVRHEIEWQADAAPAPLSLYFAGEACDEGAGQGAGFMRHATASGDVFGRRVSRAGIDHALLSRGAMLTECAGRALARRAAAGKTVTVTFR